VPCPEKDEVVAIVTGFSRSGDIVFATNEHYGTITFKQTLDVWLGQPRPAIDQVVILTGIAMFKRGWRATKARPYVPSDETNEILGKAE
jgi:hypothetical protein